PYLWIEQYLYRRWRPSGSRTSTTGPCPTECPGTASTKVCSSRSRPGSPDSGSGHRIDNAVELAFTPTYGSWANPIEAHFGPLRQFTIANSDHQSHAEMAKAIRAYIRWRNAHTTDPEVLALERKHRARMRGEAQRRWGQPKARAA